MFITNLEIAFISKFPSAFQVPHSVPLGMLAPLGRKDCFSQLCVLGLPGLNAGLLSDGDFAAQSDRLCASFLLFPFWFFF